MSLTEQYGIQNRIFSATNNENNNFGNPVFFFVALTLDNDIFLFFCNLLLRIRLKSRSGQGTGNETFLAMKQEGFLYLRFIMQLLISSLR